MSVKISRSILQALRWSFRIEMAQIELPDPRDIEDRGFGFGMEYVLIERAKLGGVQIDKSPGTSSPHIDAEAIAGIVSTLGQQFGGRGMALQIAELARSDTTPGWMPGAIPRLVPVAWRQANQTGQVAKTEVIAKYFETFRVPHPKARNRMIERRREILIEYTPCRWEPSLGQIQNVRASYSRWWSAIDEVRANLIAANCLKTIWITDSMPPQRPWLRSEPPVIPAAETHPRVSTTPRGRRPGSGRTCPGFPTS